MFASKDIEFKFKLDLLYTIQQVQPVKQTVPQILTFFHDVAIELYNITKPKLWRGREVIFTYPDTDTTIRLSIHVRKNYDEDHENLYVEVRSTADNFTLTADQIQQMHIEDKIFDHTCTSNSFVDAHTMGFKKPTLKNEKKIPSLNKTKTPVGPITQDIIDKLPKDLVEKLQLNTESI
jgi:hypothetical protein